MLDAYDWFVYFSEGCFRSPQANHDHNLNSLDYMEWIMNLLEQVRSTSIVDNLQKSEDLDFVVSLKCYYIVMV